MISIKTKEFTETKKADKIRINITNLELFESVSFQVMIFTNDEEYIKTECFCLRDNDYKNWASDDNYIINFVMNKLGLIKL